MATLRFELTGRFLAGIAAASLLAGVSVDAAADYTDQPRIRLQLGAGSDTGKNRFILEEVLDGQPKTVAEQVFGTMSGGSKCIVDQGKWSGVNLVSFVALPDPTVDPPGGRNLGMGPDSIGVYDNSKGVSCYRMTAAILEGLEFRLDGDGKTIESLPKQSTDPLWNFAFNRLELDMEVKQNAMFIVTVYAGLSDEEGTDYYLYSGRNIGLPEAAGATDGEQNPLQTKFKCTATSDSGPDSGPNDNCRWIINDYGVKFTLEAYWEGEGSIEGGGDFPDAYAKNTIVYLTKIRDEGRLTCCDGNDAECLALPANAGFDNVTGQVGDGIGTASCQVTRLTTLENQTDVCAKVFEYDLNTKISNVGECNLTPSTTSWTQQLAAQVEIRFPPEVRTDIAVPFSRTTVQFSCIPGDTGCGLDGLTTPVFTPERCEGTVVADANGNSTIQEVLEWLTDPTVDDDWDWKIVDQYSGNGALDWACILDSRIEYIGDDKQQHVDKALFWGDARFSTQ